MISDLEKEIIESWSNRTFPFFVMDRFEHQKATLQEISIVYDALILYGLSNGSAGLLSHAHPNPQYLREMTSKAAKLAIFFKSKSLHRGKLSRFFAKGSRYEP